MRRIESIFSKQDAKSDCVSSAKCGMHALAFASEFLVLNSRR